MQFDFFATDDDIRQVWRLLFDVPSMRIFEDYSKPDQSNHWMSDWDEFLIRFEDHKGFLTAWPQCVGGLPRESWVEFEPNTQKKLRARGRTILESPALINVFQSGEYQGCLGNVSMKCWNEKGARQRSFFSEQFCDEVDWPQFRSILAKVQRQIKKMCPAKLRNVPIMHDAFEKFHNGHIKLWNWGQQCAWPSEFVSSF